MAAVLAERGLSAVADVVPNHMAVPTPVRLNHALWSVLRDGPASPFADWFDVDWRVPDRAILMPVLGSRIGTALVQGEITVDRSGDEPVLRYFDHEFRSGRHRRLPIEELVDRRVPARLVAGRRRGAQLPAVLRRRHPRRDPGRAARGVRPPAPRARRPGPARRADRAADRPPRTAWPTRAATCAGSPEPRTTSQVVVGKILEGDEQPPQDWPCRTTGYDALQRVGGLFVDPSEALRSTGCSSS